MKRLGCPCGGKVELRGDVRLYEQGDAVEDDEGERTWKADTWKTPIETIETDDPPFHCLDCDRQLALAELVPLRGQGYDRAAVSPFGSNIRTG